MGKKGSTPAATDGAKRMLTVAKGLGQDMGTRAAKAVTALGVTGKAGKVAGKAGAAGKMAGMAGRTAGKAGTMAGMAGALTGKAGQVGFKAGRRVGRAEASVRAHPMRTGLIAAGAVAGIAAAGAGAVAARRRGKDAFAEPSDGSVPVTVVDKTV